MNTTLLSAALLVALSCTLHATTWLVGPARPYTAPSQVSSLVGDGDTVEIDAGVYESDVARWTANDLVLKGVGGYAHLRANGTSYGKKAIWVIGGTNTTVQWIEFSLCACPDHNGAGIRQEGVGLTVQHCYFHDNEDGILAGDNPTSDIRIEYTEFANNGFGDGYSHNLYINHVRSLVFMFNYSHHAKVGHELKSRAYTNHIMYNRLANEATGTASREIDLPNGGTAVVVGNEIEQGPNGENSNILGYGLEGLSNPTPHQLYVASNTFVNDRGAGSFVAVQNGTELLKMYDNILAGPGAVFTGAPSTVDTAANLNTSIANAGFVDASGYDYHLTAESPGVNMGVPPGSVDGDTPLTPIYEYAHPADKVERRQNGALDIGAHERTGTTGVASGASSVREVKIYPNPIRTSATIRVDGMGSGGEMTVFDVMGRAVRSISIGESGESVMERDGMASGVYYYSLRGVDGREATGAIVVE